MFKNGISAERFLLNRQPIIFPLTKTTYEFDMGLCPAEIFFGDVGLIVLQTQRENKHEINFLNAHLYAVTC